MPAGAYAKPRPRLAGAHWQAGAFEIKVMPERTEHEDEEFARVALCSDTRPKAPVLNIFNFQNKSYDSISAK
jgi:hypothetical protein